MSAVIAKIFWSDSRFVLRSNCMADIRGWGVVVWCGCVKYLQMRNEFMRDLKIPEQRHPEKAKGPDNPQPKKSSHIHRYFVMSPSFLPHLNNSRYVSCLLAEFPKKVLVLT